MNPFNCVVAPFGCVCANHSSAWGRSSFAYVRVSCLHYFTGAYDNVKALVSAGAIPLLLDAARGFEEESSTLSSLYLALKQLAANDESVKLVSCPDLYFCFIVCGGNVVCSC